VQQENFVCLLAKNEAKDDNIEFTTITCTNFRIHGIRDFAG
jgi:hypothetical protein